MSPETGPPHIHFETTPNPRARKVVLDVEIRIGSPISYQLQNGPLGGGALIEALLDTEHITDLFLKGQILTVTQDGAGSWFLLEAQISQLINTHLPQHNPSYTPPEPVIHQKSIRAREGSIDKLTEPSLTGSGLS